VSTDRPDDSPTPPPAGAADAAGLRAAAHPDSRGGLRLFLLLDLGVRLFVWGNALTLSLITFNAWQAWPTSPLGAAPLDVWHTVRRVTEFVLLFNAIYVLELVVLRLLVPTPREGRYRLTEHVPPRPVLYSTLLATLTKARLQAPFPGFLVFHLANLPPLCWLMGPVFGPRSRSAYVTEPQVLDPHFVTIGRNVTIGLNAIIAGHYQLRDEVVFKRTIIEDNVVIGAHAAVGGGVHIKAGAIVGAGSVVLPDTVIGENEFWFGVPARRVKRLAPTDAPPADTA
jgi:hypothetical protein